MSNVNISRMLESHIDDALFIERECFSIPWSRAEIAKEIKSNTLAAYFVAEADGKIVGYAGLWHIINEGHITNIAVLPEYRRLGVGRALLGALTGYAKQKEMIGLTLEVRMSNEAAQRLYTSSGFKPEGFRKKYYADTGEDAVIMWLYFTE